MQQSIVFMLNEFERRLEVDDFGDLAPHVLLTSICQFIDNMTFGNVVLDKTGRKDAASFPDLTDLNITFADFLRLSIRVGSRNISLLNLFRSDFCQPAVKAILMLVMNNGVGRDAGPHGGSPLRELGLCTWPQWGSEMQRPERMEALVNACLDSALNTLADRTLMSFFIRSPVPGEFSAWGPYASSGHGRKLPTRIVNGDGYDVTVCCSKYVESDGPVAAYEWEARLTMTGATEHDAVACGMVYVFDRADGMPIGEIPDFIIASGQVADMDVLQVVAFINQHSDAIDIIDRSDLCFVWLWERKNNSEKGVGAKCLTAALQDLRRRFKKVSTAVFCIQPTQFKLWDAEIDPPMVALEKQTATENIVNYVRKLKDVQRKFDMLPIFVRSQTPQQDAHNAVAMALAEKHIANIGEYDGVGIDVDKWREELIDLFERAGFDDLAEALKDEAESYQEVELALDYLVFESQVNYLRLPASSEFRTDAFGVENVSPEDAYDNGDFVRFEDELPNDMEVVDVWRDDEHDDDQLICEVHAHTPFGTLREFFVLIPKPRQFNIETFFRDIRD